MLYGVVIAIFLKVEKLAHIQKAWWGKKKKKKAKWGNKSIFWNETK